MNEVSVKVKVEEKSRIRTKLLEIIAKICY